MFLSFPAKPICTFFWTRFMAQLYEEIKPESSSCPAAREEPTLPFHPLGAGQQAVSRMWLGGFSKVSRAQEGGEGWRNAGFREVVDLTPQLTRVRSGS